MRGQEDNPEIRAERKKKQQTLEETTAAAADFYAQQLKFNPAARAYLDKRGLSAEVIAHYGLGYAPDGWQPFGTSVPTLSEYCVGGYGHGH